MANGIDYRIGFPNKTIEAMLKSDVPMIREQAQEIIRSQGINNMNIGQVSSMSVKDISLFFKKNSSY